MTKMDEFKPEVPKSEKPYNKYEGEVLYSGAPSDQESMDSLSNDQGHEARGSLETTTQKPEKRGLSLKTKVGVGLAAAAVLIGGGSVAAKKAMNQGHPTTTGPLPTNPSPSTTTSPEASPSATASPAETVPTIETIEMDASLINSPEKLIKTFEEDKLTEWFNAGATLENAKAALDSKDSIPAYAAKIAAQYDKTFIDALFVKDWESNSNIAALIDRIKATHANTLELYFYTAPSAIDPGDRDPGDIEPYKRGNRHIRTDSITNQTKTSVTIEATTQNYNNSGLNRVGEDLTSGDDISGAEVQTTTTFQVVDGKIRISGFTPDSTE